MDPNRQTGRTTRMLEEAQKHPNAVIVVLTDAQRVYIESMARRLGFERKPEVVVATRNVRDKLERVGRGGYRPIYVDHAVKEMSPMAQEIADFTKWYEEIAKPKEA